MTWPSYVINLKANTARMQNSATQFEAAGLPWHAIEAVNGWELPEAEIARVYDIDANRRRAKYPLVRPEIGCYLSHIAAWRRIADGEADGGFIFEDDFRADQTLGPILRLLTEDPRDWDMVKLFTFDTDPKCLARRPLGEGFEIVVPYRVPTCLIGYGLAKEAAGRLADRAIPFCRPVDEDQKWVWETGLRVSVVLPAPISVGDQQAVTGTIGSERREAARNSRGRARHAIHSLVYQLRYNVLLFWHRRVRRR